MIQPILKFIVWVLGKILIAIWDVFALWHIRRNLESYRSLRIFSTLIARRYKIFLDTKVTKKNFIRHCIYYDGGEEEWLTLDFFIMLRDMPGYLAFISKPHITLISQNVRYNFWRFWYDLIINRILFLVFFSHFWIRVISFFFSNNIYWYTLTARPHHQYVQATKFKKAWTRILFSKSLWGRAKNKFLLTFRTKKRRNAKKWLRIALSKCKFKLHTWRMGKYRKFKFFVGRYRRSAAVIIKVLYLRRKAKRFRIRKRKLRKKKKILEY